MMKRIELKIEYEHGQERGFYPVDAWVAAPGLAVHRIRYLEKEWAVTHIPTGHYLMEYLTRKAALSAAKRFAALGDWDREQLPRGLLAAGRALARRLAVDLR